MVKDLTIRLLGRPQVSEDSSAGFQKLVRKYVVQGSRASKTGIEDSENPLFLPVGTKDEEFDDHYLINQQLEGNPSTMEKASLTRECVELRNTWASQSVSDSGPLETINRKYFVIRAENSISLGFTLGYSPESWLKHPINSRYHENKPWDYVPKVIEDTEPESSAYEVAGFDNHKWQRKTASVDTSNPGLDVWDVSWVAPIRPLGRPLVTLDSVTGFKKVVRQYLILSSKADDGSVLSDVGTLDPIFANHYLTNERIEPSNQVSISTLTREYNELRNTFHSETFVQTNDLVKINRKYTVLRNNDSTYGYGANWSKHPYNGGGSIPWSYAPPQIQPPANNTDYSLNTDFTVNGASPQVSLATGSVDLGTLLSGIDYQSWLRGKASVQAVNPGLDTWDVEYVAPVEPYRTVGTSKGAGSKSVAFTVVGFDTNGIKLSKLGTVGNGTSFIMTETHVAYHIGEQLPTDLGNIGGSSGSGYVTSSVSFDIALTDDDGRKYSIQRMIPTAVFDTSSIQELKQIKNSDNENMGSDVVDDSPSYGINLIYNPHSQSDTAINKLPKNKMPLFQNTPHYSMVGTISWTRRLSDPTGGGAYLSATTLRVTPVFSYGKKKIWKLETTYIG